MDNFSDISFEKIKENIYHLINRNIMGKSVVDALYCNSSLVRKECELWDFKKKPSGTNEKSSYAKTILQILSFYNTYGGYLIYGIDEIEEDYFEPVGIEKNTFERKKLRDLASSYISSNIDFNYEEFDVELGEWSGLIGILQIPKRKKNIKPLFFTKNGPADDKGKLIFEKETVYIRIQDNCVLAKKTQHWEILNTERELIFDANITYKKNTPPLDHNLPDRNLICSKFIGRSSIIEAAIPAVTL